MSELLPCPFCGVHLVANTNQKDLHVRRYGTHYDHPDNDCILAQNEVTPTEIPDWNRRASPAPVQQEPTYSGITRESAVGVWPICPALARDALRLIGPMSLHADAVTAHRVIETLRSIADCSDAPVQQPAGEPMVLVRKFALDEYLSYPLADEEVDERVKALADELSAAPQGAAAQRWQPIESAPRDGTRVLVWKYGYTITCAEFVNGKWYSSDLQSLRAARTHWMPLPAEPQRTAPQPASAPTGEGEKS